MNLKSRYFFLPLLLVALYLVPNMVQDFHRVFHHHKHQINTVSSLFQIHSYEDNCAVCVFEFNALDEIQITNYTSLRFFYFQTLEKRQIHQIASFVFNYFDLRGPPANLL